MLMKSLGIFKYWLKTYLLSLPTPSRSASPTRRIWIELLKILELLLEGTPTFPSPFLGTSARLRPWRIIQSLDIIRDDDNRLLDRIFSFASFRDRFTGIGISPLSSLMVMMFFLLRTRIGSSSSVSSAASILVAASPLAFC
jgi:hypothetical protein